MSKIEDDIIKRVVWDLYFENILLDIWEANVPLLKSSVRNNRNIYKKMTLELAEAGLELHWSKIKIKLDNLVRRYRIELNEMAKTDARPERWHHFQKVDNIMTQLATEITEEEKEMMRKNAADVNAENQNVAGDAGVDAGDDAGDDVVVDNDGDNVADADDIVSQTDSNHSLIIATSEESLHGYCSPTADEPPAKRNKSNKSPKMTSFERAMVEIAKAQTKDLNRAAMKRLEILKRMASNTANYHAKMLEMLAKSING